MDRSERFYKIDQLLSEQRSVSFDKLLDVLEVSRATLKRDLEYMRNRLNAPIEWDRESRGYRFTDARKPGRQYELPGLWFSPTEIHALLTMQHLLSNIDPGGLLASHIKPLMSRLDGLLGSVDSPADEIRKRVLIAGVGKRHLKLAHFEKVGSALLNRKRLHIGYYSRGKGEITERDVSPQRMVYYRENWYLDAWCHLRKEVRNFSLDSIRHCAMLNTAARDVPRKALEHALGPGYGIFTGHERDRKQARLRFTVERARWVASESWHPDQKGAWLEDGGYQLEFPYFDDRELIMDILKHGADVTVLGPKDLRMRVAEEAKRMTVLYT
jgi:predicted DNA-binding transcriptional regulator YafY